jgi:hypothetical protein
VNTQISNRIALVIEKFKIPLVSAVKFPPATQSRIFTTADTRDHKHKIIGNFLITRAITYDNSFLINLSSL